MLRLIVRSFSRLYGVIARKRRLSRAEPLEFDQATNYPFF
jgi:hypothetical protein